MDLVKYFEELDRSLKSLNHIEVILAIKKLFDGIYNCQLADARELLSLYSTCDYLSNVGFDNSSIQRAINAYVFSRRATEEFRVHDKSLSWHEIYSALAVLKESKKTM